ncbi:hypothetical protein QP166_14530 [Sphingomonas sp. LR60]|uniref:hypothetical protein n=1 Tax=Sphingomonas sp. LR60 TaxID=3050233 RepID=UPI002FE20DE3
MTSVEILGLLLRGHEPLTDVVPIARIKAGRLPEDAALPSLLIREVSIVDRHTLRRTGWSRSTARVSVMVRAVSYADQLAVMKLVRGIPTGAIGAVGDAGSVVVHLAGGGPDVIGPADTFEKTQDFRVAFDTLD